MSKDDPKPSVQAQRSAATRRKLLDAARPLFAEQGYAAVGTEQIVRSAGVTRGAMYHQFADKLELFAALVEEEEQAVTEQIAAGALAQPGDAYTLLHAGAIAFLDQTADPAIRQLLLIDAPSVLGHARWRELGLKYGLGLVEALLRQGIESGVLKPAPPRPLAHVLLGALDEAALMVAGAEDPASARDDALTVLDLVLGALRAES